MDTRKKIKELIEELNYRTDHKSSSELYNLSRKLFELSVLELHGSAVEENTPTTPKSQVTPPTPEPLTEPVQTKEDPVVEVPTPIEKEEESEIEVEPIEEKEAEEKEVEEERIPPVNETEESPENASIGAQKSLNDVLGKTLNIGFNDRFAFVNKLFDGNQDDYNRVISQLNTMKSFVEARNFIESIVKPDYNWSDSEEYEVRFMEILERHFD